jgi:hypothetical protein
MWQMVRIKTDILASVGGLSVDFGDQCHFFPDDHKIQERDCTV